MLGFSYPAVLGRMNVGRRFKSPFLNGRGISLDVHEGLKLPNNDVAGAY